MSIIDGFWKLLGVQNEVEEEILETPSSSYESSKELKNLTNNIVSIHTNKTLKVVVCEPQRFEEAKELADHLKNRRQIILNFEATAPEVSQRIIDFLSGTVYSLDGQTQQIGKNIFVFAPSNVEINKDGRFPSRKSSFNPFEMDGGDSK